MNETGKPLNLKFDEVFKISTTSLRINRGHPDIKRDCFWKLQFTLIITTCLATFICLTYSSLCHDVKAAKYADASKNAAMAIVFISITLKYYMLLIHQELIQNMIKYIERDYSEDNNYSEEDKETILEYVQKGVNVCIFWLYAYFATCAMFPLKAFVSMAYHYWKGEFKLVPLFAITFPEPIESYKDSIAVFWIWFAMTFLFDVYASSMNVGFDPIIPICMLHVCGQTELLSRRLTRIFAEIEDPKEIQNQLRFIIMKVQSLYELIGEIKSSFRLLFEVNMKATTFVLPLMAFQIMEDLRNQWVNVEFVVFFWACVIHFFVPCYYSDKLLEKSEIFRQEIYASGWHKCSDISVRHTILLMLTRARVPMGIRSIFYEISLDTFAESEIFRQEIYASGWHKCSDISVRHTILLMLTRARVPMGIRSIFYEISLDTFAEMCRQGYGIFSLMNAAWG